MKRPLTMVALAAIAALNFPKQASAQSQYDGLISSQAQANGVPEALVHRVIQRESRYQAGLTGRGGCIGLMQIKLATARGLGYTGDAAGLRDPNRAMHYYASGYYGAAKRQGNIAQGSANEPLQANAMAPQPYHRSAHGRRLR